MKKLTCDLCDFAAEGESFEQWMENLKPHYMEAHADVMQDPRKTDADRMQWMKENQARFDAA